MDEADWLKSTDPAAMLEWRVYGRPGGIPARIPALTDRQIRLWACAVAQQTVSETTHPEVRRGLEIAYLEADNVFQVDWVRIRYKIREEHNRAILARSLRDHIGADLVRELLTDDARSLVVMMPVIGQQLSDGGVVSMETQAGLLREVVGNPFRPLPKLRGWKRSECKGCSATPNEEGEICHESGCYMLSEDGGRSEMADEILMPWLMPTVINLAQTAYDAQDWSALPILADALEDAGCADEAILRHLRGWERCPECIGSSGFDRRANERCSRCRPANHDADHGWISLRCSHVRGCHVLDAILGKNVAPSSPAPRTWTIRFLGGPWHGQERTITERLPERLVSDVHAVTYRLHRRIGTTETRIYVTQEYPVPDSYADLMRQLSAPAAAPAR
jgi:hypothetical protein